jgi:uncharacterized integral membrane protein (TIGR00698 family)
MVGKKLPKWKKVFGLIVITAPGIGAYLVSCIYPALDALFLALIFGISLGSFLNNLKIRHLSEKSLAITLPLGIVLYGAKIKIPLPSDFPPQVIVLTIFSTLLMGAAVFLFAKKFGVGEKLSLLLACGTAICGVSAITIVSSIVKPKKEEFSAAIIVITVVGLTGAILYPFLGYHLGLSPEYYAILSGATLHQTGLVEIASLPFGNYVMQEGLAVKGLRIALISVVTLLISFIYAENRFYVPWYVVTFLIVAFLSSFVLTPEIVKVIEPLSTIAFSITLASIGLSVNIRDIQRVRLSPSLLLMAGGLLHWLYF